MKNNKVYLTDLKHVTTDMWNELGAKKESELKILVEGTEHVRETILHDPSYKEETFPEGFDVKGFIRAVVGDKNLGHPQVMDFRRAMTALCSVVPLKLPENFILMDDITHTAACILMNKAVSMRQEEATDSMDSLDPEEVAARVKASSEKMDSEQLVKDVLAGDTTYDKDEDFMNSSIVVGVEDAELVSLDEARAGGRGMQASIQPIDEAGYVHDTATEEFKEVEK